MSLPEKTYAIFTANHILQRNGDVEFPFAQDKNFWYLTGLQIPEAHLILSSGVDKVNTRETLVLPNRDSKKELWDGEEDISSVIKASGIEHIIYRDELTTYLERILKDSRTVLLSKPDVASSLGGVYPQPARKHLVNYMKKNFPQTNLQYVDPMINELRAIKRKPEISAIKRAIELTLGAIKKVEANMQNITYEYQIASELQYEYAKHNAKLGFESIVASGVNATTIHYRKLGSKVQKSELLLIDTGAQVDEYCADISRTIFVSSDHTQRQKDVVEAVQNVHDYAISLLKPGVLVGEYEKQVRAKMAEYLKDMGLIKGKEPKEVYKYYPHATSHFLGLDVHDVGDYSKPLRKNMILTVEPGIYIQSERIGVRIENDILLTETGAINLST